MLLITLGTSCAASAVDECVKHAENLLRNVNHWLKENIPELID